MKQAFVLTNSYSYIDGITSSSEIRQKGVLCAQAHGRNLRDAAERAVCRFYQVPSLQDCNADHILERGNHHYKDGVPFRVIDLKDNQFLITDLKTKREIFTVNRFNVERGEFEQQSLSDASAVTVVTMNISQSYYTFDGVK